MKFVKDDQSHIIKFGIVLETFGQNAFGEYLHASLFGCPRIQTGDVPDFLPGLLSEEIGHAHAGCPGGQSSRFENQDLAALKPGFMHEMQGDDGGFSGTGKGLQNRAIARTKGGGQIP
ncbi:hypothetical protein DPF_1706 [Desulfoplanes formicivorans]|uniref:Uncharacterized protein n=1 Tax=Desulfoplanes formicivorans TaxID=1592317 RepID=A0A194AFX8_9BACT|nr:hypothetical protein DPF_1706 [Desulfoplanes formicivorans]